MSDLVTAAAGALGIPEGLVERSAAARATESGMSVDDILQAWSGGGSVPAAPPPAPASPEPIEEHEETPTAPEPESPFPAPAAAPATPARQGAPSSPTTSDGRPPVLVGVSDRPMTIVVASIGLFVAMMLVGLVGPSVPVDQPGARSSDIDFTGSAEDGQEIYIGQVCAGCHTQMVRPIVSDVGLGAVTLSDSNQVLGTRRFGPDLSDVGSRKTGSEMEAIIEGFGGHARFNLSDDDMSDLISYLLESKTTVSE